MKNKLIYPAVLMVVFAGACGGDGGGRKNASQAAYETVAEGSASGVTSTIHGPGETLPPITGTNADTTTAFALNPNAVPPAGAPGAQVAGTLPPPTPMYGGAPSGGSYSPSPAPVPRATPSYSSPSPQPRQVYVPPSSPAPSSASQQQSQPQAQPEPVETTEPQPAGPTDTSMTQSAPPTSTNTAPPPQAKPKQEQNNEAPPSEDSGDEPAEEPPPPPPPARA